MFFLVTVTSPPTVIVCKLRALHCLKIFFPNRRPKKFVFFLFDNINISSIPPTQLVNHDRRLLESQLKIHSKKEMFCFFLLIWDYTTEDILVEYRIVWLESKKKLSGTSGETHSVLLSVLLDRLPAELKQKWVWERWCSAINREKRRGKKTQSQKLAKAHTCLHKLMECSEYLSYSALLETPEFPIYFGLIFLGRCWVVLFSYSFSVIVLFIGRSRTEE